MESYQTQIMAKPSLGVLGIFKESMKIPIRYPKFIIFSVLTSLPLFCAMLLHEIALQRTLIPLPKALSAPQTPICSQGICYYTQRSPLDYIEIVLQQVSQKYLFPGLVCLQISLVLDLIVTVAVVNWASTIYLFSGDGSDSVKFKKVDLGGPLVTSAYVLLLASLTLTGLAWLAGQCSYPLFVGPFGSGFGSMSAGRVVFLVLYVALFVGLLGKYEEWSGVWNMGMVMSVVEGGEKQGIVAIGVGAYLSRGCRLRGAVLALVFFAWRVGLRALGLYLVWGVQDTDDVVAVNGVLAGLVCLGNVMKWVVFTVYFCDCKKRFLEKKVDAEDGRAVPAPPPQPKEAV